MFCFCYSFAFVLTLAVCMLLLQMLSCSALACSRTLRRLCFAVFCFAYAYSSYYSACASFLAERPTRGPQVLHNLLKQSANDWPQHLPQRARVNPPGQQLSSRTVKKREEKKKKQHVPHQLCACFRSHRSHRHLLVASSRGRRSPPAPLTDRLRHQSEARPSTPSRRANPSGSNSS